MKHARVTVKNVDNSLAELSMNDKSLRSLMQMKKSGYTDREIWNVLFSDDWNPPPVFVTIKWKDESGRSVEETLNLYYKK